MTATGMGHVSGLSILFMFVSVLVCFGLPIGLAIWAGRRYRGRLSFIAVLAGAAGFFVSQIIFRVPLLQAVLPAFEWFKRLQQMPWAYIAFLSFTAGLVEEPARFIAFSLMRKRRSFVDGLGYGIGHGGIEAIIVVGLSYVGNIALSIAINSGTLGALGSSLPASVVSSLTDTPSYLFLVGGLERVFAVSLQIALSLVVLSGFQVGRRAVYLVFAILLHGLANFVAVTLSQIGPKVMPGSPLLGGVVLSESALLIIAIVSVLYIAGKARAFRAGEPGPAEPAVPGK